MALKNYKPNTPGLRQDNSCKERSYRSEAREVSYNKSSSEIWS